MDEIDNYRLLTPVVPAAPVQPLMIWDLSIPGGGDDVLNIAPSSNAKMTESLEKAAGDFSTKTRVAEPSACQRDVSVLLPSLSLVSSWEDEPSNTIIEKFGRTVSLDVLEILRLPKY